MQKTLNERWHALTERLDGVGAWLAPLGLRLLLAWEFWEAGIEKYRGENWFGGIQSDFPFPFNVVPPDISWTLATWFELGGAIALLIGLGTRFFAFNLFVLTMVATASVHWPMDWQNLQDLAMGYAISDKGFGNFKLPLIFAAMLLPLIFHGAGKFSLDALVSRWAGTGGARMRGIQDVAAWGIALLVIGAPLSLLLPTLGLGLAIGGVVLVAADRLLLA
jgi:putative oxidoreductase